MAAGHGPAAAADTSIPMVGNTLTLLLDLSRYVVEREGGALVLVNEALLLSNLNENVLGRYGLRASSVHADPNATKKRRKVDGGHGFFGRNATELLVTAVAVVAAVAFVAAAARARRR